MTRILIPSGALGLDYDREALRRGVEMQPDLIAIDGGSTDSGPSYLGRGVSKYSRASTKIEWAGLMEAAREAGCPLVIGTAGTCGSDDAVDWLLDITFEVLNETGRNARIAVLKSGQKAATVQNALETGRVKALEAAPEISPAILDDCTNIVALAGAEQINAALAHRPDIVIAGRTTDTAIIAALPLARGEHAGAAWHGAKIGECGALCATHPQSGVIMLEIDSEGFVVTPLAKDAYASPHTVSAHMLYENADPYRLHEPGGYLDVSKATYQSAPDNKSVRVEGSDWVPTNPYTVKLEGARISGYQTILLTTIRDPHYIKHVDQWCDQIIQNCSDKVRARLGLQSSDFRIELRQIGKDATLGSLENRQGDPIELGVLGIVTANSQDIASEIGKLLNPYLLHHPLTKEEEVPTFAFPFSPAEIDRGAVYEFCLNHVMELDDPMAAFRLEVVEV